MNRFAALAAIACSACIYPSSETPPGPGEYSPAATQRLQAAVRAALIETARGAVAAADEHPDDVRLQRRAAEMIRELATAKQPIDRAMTDRVLARLAATPCPGLADIAATRDALDDATGAGDAYLEAARSCASVDAAIAAVHPLRKIDRCTDAIAGLRDVWPQVDRRNSGVVVAFLDAVTECSDTMSLRANLSFVPSDVLQDYLAVLDERARVEAEQAARAEAQRREGEARERARASAAHCESECQQAESSCDSSCEADASCMQTCSSLLHACSAGCGAS